MCTCTMCMHMHACTCTCGCVCGFLSPLWLTVYTSLYIQLLQYMYLYIYTASFSFAVPFLCSYAGVHITLLSTFSLQGRWNNAYGHKSSTLRWQHFRLHKPSLRMQKQQQGIPISLEMGSMESYPLHPSESVDFFSDPLALDSDRECTSLPGQLPL